MYHPLFNPPTANQRMTVDMTVQGLITEINSLEGFANQGLLNDILAQLQLYDCKQRLEQLLSFIESQTLRHHYEM